MEAKTIKLDRRTTRHLEDKLPIAVLKEILQRRGEEYTDDEVEKIRDFFYRLAEIGYEHYLRRKQKGELIQGKIIDINTHYENSQSTKSHPLHQGEYRRTG